MEGKRLRELLEGVRDGRIAPAEAAAAVEASGVAELGYATVDLHRAKRCGFPEVIFCQGKTPEHVEGVIRRLNEEGQDCLATRVDDAQAAHLSEIFPAAEQDRAARTFWLTASAVAAPVGNVLVLTAGTSDLAVAREALNTLRAMGVGAELVADVGVAGLHRLLRHQGRMAAADVIIVVAGMDGALPSVVGGLVDCPVIAVPTSVGYGASFGGVAALLTMLNACSAGVVAVNIDAGFKAGYTAALIARRVGREGPTDHMDHQG